MESYVSSHSGMFLNVSLQSTRGLQIFADGQITPRNPY